MYLAVSSIRVLEPGFEGLATTIRKFIQELPLLVHLKCLRRADGHEVFGAWRDDRCRFGLCQRAATVSPAPVAVILSTFGEVERHVGVVINSKLRGVPEYLVLRLLRSSRRISPQSLRGLRV